MKSLFTILLLALSFSLFSQSTIYDVPIDSPLENVDWPIYDEPTEGMDIALANVIEAKIDHQYVCEGILFEITKEDSAYTLYYAMPGEYGKDWNLYSSYTPESIHDQLGWLINNKPYHVYSVAPELVHGLSFSVYYETNGLIWAIFDYGDGDYGLTYLVKGSNIWQDRQDYELHKLYQFVLDLSSTLR